MGLLSILKKIREKEKEIRILILGLDNAGKTTVVKQLCKQPIDAIEPTLGFQIQTLRYDDKYQLHLWDIGGQRTIRSYWRNYFEATDGLVWVVDSVDLHRMELCRLELAKVLQQERLAGATLLILANKQDIDGAMTLQEISKVLQLDSLGKQNRHWNIFACSAVDGYGVQDGFDWIVQDIASRIYMLS